MQPVFPPSTPPARFDTEAEMLQTDVMRFMALLGFVLVGIFALVQSLPVGSGRSMPELEQRASLLEDIRRLEAHIAERRITLDRLREQIAIAQRRKARILSDSEALTGELRRIIESVGSVYAALNRGERELVKVRSELARERRTLSALRTQVERERTMLQRVEGRLAQLRQDMLLARTHLEERLAEAGRDEQQASQGVSAGESRQEAANEAPARTAVPTPTEAEAAGEQDVPRRGFTLKFESERAFDRLVRNEIIDFYAIIGDRAWQAARVGRVIRFGEARRPPSYYEMTPTTVPTEYVNSFRTVAAVPERTSVVWATVLPARMTRAIRTAIEGKTSADVIILDDGKVRLENVST